MSTLDNMLTDEERGRIVELYRAGKRTAEITAATGAPRSTIYYVLKEEGVTPQRQGRRPTGVPRGTELPPTEHTALLDWALARVIELERENGALREKLRIAAEALA